MILVCVCMSFPRFWCWFRSSFKPIFLSPDTDSLSPASRHFGLSKGIISLTLADRPSSTILARQKRCPGLDCASTSTNHGVDERGGASQGRDCKTFWCHSDTQAATAPYAASVSAFQWRGLCLARSWILFRRKLLFLSRSERLPCTIDSGKRKGSWRCNHPTAQPYSCSE